MRNLLLISVLLLNGCSSLHSIFDDVHLVWKQDKNIDDALLPNDFVITPKEIYRLIGPMKMSWQLYSDSRNYYLSPLHSLFPIGDNNSHLAEKHGLKICGINRNSYELIRAKLGEGGTRPIQTLRKLAENSGC